MQSEHLKHGVMPACDVTTLGELDRIVSQTNSLNFIIGYKLGIELVVKFGAKQVCNAIRKISSKILVYDHQKYGNDIPDISGGDFLNIVKDAGFDRIIAFPFAGFNTLKAIVKKCDQIGLIPVVGGEMTHHGFLWSEGGYLCDEGPVKIYEDAAKLGVQNYVVPGTKIASIKKYVKLVAKHVESPHFYFPGVGKGQGGDIASAFAAAMPYSSTAIVGRGIYASDNMREAATKLWESSCAAIESNPDVR